MGMYTELILGCKLSKNTPSVCIDALDAVINHYNEDYEVSQEVKNFIKKYDLEYMFHCASYYFGVSKPNSAFWFDTISDSWHISTRSDLKNSWNKIEEFLSYLSEYVGYGSGENDIYAYVLYEESKFPKIYAKTGVYDSIYPYKVNDDM